MEVVEIRDLPPIVSLAMDEDFPNLDAFTACPQCILHALATNIYKRKPSHKSTKAPTRGTLLHTHVFLEYLLMTDTPHSLLQNTTPGYTLPKSDKEILKISGSESTICSRGRQKM